MNRINGEWKAEVPSWISCSSGSTVACPIEWAEQIELINCSNCWKGLSANLGDDYYNNNKDVIAKLLAQGGVRLAAVLNEIYL